MKPIYSMGDKVYLTEEEDFNDYEIVEISLVDGGDNAQDPDHFMYKIKPVKGQQTIEKGESEIFPITFAWDWSPLDASPALFSTALKLFNWYSVPVA